MSPTDEQILTTYQAAVDEWTSARATLQSDGLIVADDKGRPIPHPAIAVERSASAEMRAWLPDVRRIQSTPDTTTGPAW